MALEQLEMETGLNKVDFAIKLLRDNEPMEGYYLAFSGGKDSVVIYDLAVKSGVKFDAHYCVSPIDPPQIYKFIKEHYPNVIWDYHAKGFWNMVRKEGLPRRQGRWCCRVIKESGGTNRYVITGVRGQESDTRNNYPYIEINSKYNKTYIRPILKLTDYDVWQYIRESGLPYCELYDRGFSRIGCILCPFVKLDDTLLQIQYFPKVANLWRLACNDIVAERKANNYMTKRGKPSKYKFETGEELFQWWIKRR